jgi:hypothetical protein
MIIKMMMSEIMMMSDDDDRDDHDDDVRDDDVNDDDVRNKLPERCRQREQIREVMSEMTTLVLATSASVPRSSSLPSFRLIRIATLKSACSAFTTFPLSV